MSHLEDFIDTVEAAYADPTVEFVGGRNAKKLHAQQRRIVIVRGSGVLRPSAAPGRVQFGVPLSGAGTVEQRIFERQETLQATLTAATQDDLDDMFDRFVYTVFQVSGPNAFGAESSYEWFQGDSKAGGDWVRRNPGITIEFSVRLKSRAVPGPFAVLAVAGATADFVPSGATGPAGPTGDHQALVQPTGATWPPA
jgi:hypothetical protein